MLEDDSLVNCMCSKCLQADPNGVVVTKDQHLAHKRNARQRAHVDSRLAQLRANGWDDPPLPPDRRMSLDITTEPDVELEGHSMDLDPPLARDENQEIVEELAHILKELKNSCPQKSQFNILPFVFSQTPHLYGLPGNPTEQDIDRICSLDVNTPSNADYLRYFDLLDKGAKYARMQQEHASATIRMQSLLVVETVDQSRRSLREARLADWKRQADLTKQPYFVDTTRYYQDAIPYIPVSLLLVYLIAASLYLLSNVSQDDCKFLLSALGLLLQILTASSVDIRARNAARGMFHTIGPVLALLDVVPRYASFVCCKQCYYIHWFDPNDHHTKRLERCPNTTKNGICNARFWVGKNFKYEQHQGQKAKPIRIYPYQSPQQYLSQLFARSDLKDYLYRDPCRRGAHDADPDAWDIWDADALRTFKFFDGKRYTDTSEESRLVFSLNMDGLNPYGNKQSGKKVSVGGIYMVCLNLPPEIRYNLENVYLVGIIPGPGQPSLHELNHLLKPLIDDFLILWREGIYLSRTFSRPHGIRVRGAIVPLVCDLPAARQMSGFASHSHTIFCSECKLDRHDMNNIQSDTWEPRTWEEHKYHARRWRDANTTAERRSVYAAHGVRWSELLRLPYWDPTKYTLIDSMHAFYLRLFQHHVRTIWGMDVKINDGEGPSDPTLVPPTEVEMQHAHFVLRNGSRGRLNDLKKHLLRQLCVDSGVLSVDGTRGELASRLLQYRIEQRWWTADDKHIVEENIDHVADYERLRDGTTTDDFFWHASKTTVTKAIKPDLLMVFIRHVQPTIVPPKSDEEVNGLKKELLLQYIQDERQRLGIIDENGIHATAIATQAKNQCANILGKGVLKEIRRDMQSINRPSWQPSGPRSPGEARFGKFTAAQWRTFCLINLPITLTRLWGNAHPDSFQRKCLDNFLHLVAAVKIASMNRMNEDRVQDYERHIQLYLSSLLELYPRSNITPYQHLALHFPRHLRMFGPVHAWRCFAFERYNYVIQSLPTNHKFGQLEETMFSKFCSAQRIRAIFSQKGLLPKDLAPLAGFFHENYSKRYRMNINEVFFSDDDQRDEEISTWKTDDLAPIEPAVYDALRKWVAINDPSCTTCEGFAYFRHTVRRFAQVFSTRNNHRNNSQVSFQMPGGWLPGAILNLFTHTRVSNGINTTQTFAIISPYEELPEEASAADPYRRYHVVAGRLVYNRHQDARYLVPFDDVISHLITQVGEVQGIEGKCLLTLPLDRV